MKRQPTEWEKIIASPVSDKELTQLKRVRNKQSNLKMGRRIE